VLLGNALAFIAALGAVTFTLPLRADGQLASAD